jgi:TP901 family phage tail tape measure protein
MDMFTIGLLFTAIDKVSSVVNGMCNNTITNLGKVQDKMLAVSESMKRIGFAAAGAGLMISGAIQKPIRIFADLDESQKRLKTTLMDASGAVGKEFEELKVLADKLGTALPGSSKDMIEMFIALREQGVQTKAILGGIGEATAKFAVLMKLGFSEAATHISKFQESMGVADKDAVAFMDTLQRLKFASGIEVGDLAYTFKYMGASLKTLNIQGIEDAKKLSAIIGVMAANSIEGSTAGTNFAAALGKMAEITHKLDRKRIREVIGPMLDSHRIKLDFFTEKGEFIGLEGMIKQLEKLKALSQQEKLLVLSKLFSVEAARPLSILVDKGLAGYNEMHQRMQQQADMQKKIDEIMSGTKMKWDTLSGTVSNFLAHMGGAIAGSLKLNIVFEKLNDIFGRLDAWVVRHQKLAGAIGAVVAVGGVGLVVFGSALMLLGMATKMLSHGIGAVNTFTSFIKIAIPWVRLKAMEIWRLIGAHKLLAAIEYHGGFWNTLQYFMLTTRYRILAAGGAMKFLIGGIKAFSLALLTMPVGWITMAIAGTAFLIYKFWGPISGFFKGLFKGIAEALKPLEPAWDVFKKIAPIFSPIIIPLRLIYNLVKWLIKPVNDTGKAAENLGLRFGRAIGRILSSILTLPAKMLTAGANIIDSLYQGMMSKISKPIEAIKGIAQRIRNFLPFSPAREGPFKDLHRIRIIETIAETIKPAPMLTAMGRVMSETKQVLQPITQPVFQQLHAVKTAIQPITQPVRYASAMGGAGLPSISITQNFYVQGSPGDTAVKKIASQTYTASEDAIRRVIEKYFANKARKEW